MGVIDAYFLNRNGIPIDPDIPLESVQYLAFPGPCFNSQHQRIGRIPQPQALTKKTPQLRRLRNSDVWKTGTREDQVSQMSEWFPDMSATKNPATCHDAEEIDVSSLRIKHDPPAITPTSTCPSSDIGCLQKLPGELRNRIYRLSILSDGPVQVTMPPRTCASGACLHTKSANNVPAIANTCRQLRWEAMPIYCAENAHFQFDDGTVQQSCVGNYLRSLGDYADLIPEFSFLLKRPMWDGNRFRSFATYRFTVITPRKSTVRQFELLQGEIPDPGGKHLAGRICHCTLERLVEDINSRMTDDPVADLVLEMVESEEFADYVWRVRKTKQHLAHLGRCKSCHQVVFNN